MAYFSLWSKRGNQMVHLEIVSCAKTTRQMNIDRKDKIGGNRKWM